MSVPAHISLRRQWWPIFCRTRPSSTELGPNVPDARAMSVKLGRHFQHRLASRQIWPAAGQTWTEVDQIWVNWTGVGHGSTDACQLWTRLALCRPTLDKIRPMSSMPALCRPNLALEFGRCVRRTSAEFGQIRSGIMARFPPSSGRSR